MEILLATLSRRATATQHRLLKVIYGSVMNYAHDHPKYGLDERAARGIAKRAIGTLTAPDKTNKSVRIVWALPKKRVSS